MKSIRCLVLNGFVLQNHKSHDPDITKPQRGDIIIELNIDNHCKPRRGGIIIYQATTKFSYNVS
jgi:hypothetical protein